MRLALDSSGVALGTSWLFRPLCKDKHPQTPILFILVSPSPATKFSLWFPPRAWPPQPAGITAGVRRESGKSKNQPGGGQYKLVLAGREHMGRRQSAVAGGRLLRALPAHCPPGSRNPPTSRPERQTLAGKVEESAGRTSVQAGPRRSRAPAQQETSGRRRSALQRPARPLL